MAVRLPAEEHADCRCARTVSGRAEIAGNALDDPSRRAAQSWITLVSSLRECGRGRFAKNGAGATRHLFIGGIFAAEFEQVVGVVVLGEKPEQHSARMGNGGRISIPTILEQASDGVDRSDALEVFCAGRGNGEHPVSPCPICALHHGQRQCRSMRKWQ